MVRNCGHLQKAFVTEMKSAFESLMRTHKLSFKAQANVGFTISTLEVGLPSFSRLLTTTRTSSGRLLLLLRIASITFLSTIIMQSLLSGNAGSYGEDPLSVLRIIMANPLQYHLSSAITGYLLVPLGMLLFSFFFLGLDFVLLWVLGTDKTTKKVVSWLTATIIVTIFFWILYWNPFRSYPR